jgi:hypothetical protein
MDMKRYWAFPICASALLACFALANCGGDSNGTESGSATSGIVVVNSASDYSSSSVSILDRDGNLMKDGCLYSGSGAPGLAMALSGDVVLPTQVPLGGPVAIIDRDKNNNALTWLDPVTCAPLGQMSVGTGFYSNPHDVVMLSATRAYVTRNNENGAATTAQDDFDEGNDLLIVDPTQLKITGRIDLKPFAPAGVLPGADRALLVDGKVYVSLNAISADFNTYATGRILIVDPVADQVVSFIDLPGVKNCGAMTYLPADKKLLVACDGAYSDGPQQSVTSAIVAVDLGVSPPAVLAQIAAASVGGLPFTNTTVAALDGNTALGVTLGNSASMPPDRLLSLPLDGSLPVRIFESTESFTLGAVLADPENHRVLVVDGTMLTPAFVRFFDFAAGTFTAGKTVKTNPSQSLPPRALAFY